MFYLTCVVFAIALYTSLSFGCNVIACLVVKKDIPILTRGLMVVIPWTVFFFLMGV